MLRCSCYSKVVNGPTSLGPNPVRTQKHLRKKKKVKLSLKILAMLPSYLDYIFVHLRQKARLRPELSQSFCQL